MRTPSLLGIVGPFLLWGWGGLFAQESPPVSGDPGIASDSIYNSSTEGGDGSDEDESFPLYGDLRLSAKALALSEKERNTGDQKDTGLFRLTLRGDLEYDGVLFSHVNGRIIRLSSDKMGETAFETEWGERNPFHPVDPTHRIMDEPEDRATLDLREAWIKYEGESWSIKGGRQRINWGEGRFFDPLNVVSPMDPASLEQDELSGTDSLHGVYWISGDTQIESVLTGNRLRNEMRSDFERSRTYRVPSYLEDPWNPAAWISYEEKKLYELDPQIESRLQFTGLNDRYRDGTPPVLYQDLAFRLRGPLDEAMDSSLVAGWKGRRSYLGADWNGAFLGAAFRAGAIYFSAMDLDREAVNRIDAPFFAFAKENQGYGQVYAGADYTLSRYLTIAVQYFYNGGALVYRPRTALYIAGLADPTGDRDAYDILRTGVPTYQPHYLNLALSGDINDLIRYEFYLFGDINGHGALGIAQIVANATDNLVLSFGLRGASKGAPLSDFADQDDGVFLIAEYSIL